MHRLLAALLLLLAALPAAAAERVALLIGNSIYETKALSLRNPANDVAAMAQVLGELGFVVITAQDATKSDMDRALAAFEGQAQGAEVALFFYAGHGAQAEGENYMLATDFRGSDAAAVKAASLTMGDVRAAISRARPRAGILILDACRDNPLEIRGISGPGLARTQTGAGLLIAYATDPGNVAFEGTGENSVFTTALLRHIREPGLDARLMFGRVRQDVVLRTRGAQVPWVEESLLGPVLLNPSLSAAGREAMVARDIEAWRVASASTDPEAYEKYLRDFPNGLFRDFARTRLETLRRVATARDGDRKVQLAALDITRDTEKIAAALSVLGFAPASRSSSLSLDELEAAAAAYRESLGENAAVTNENLYADASRILLYLGASVGKQIRIDIAALSSIDQTLVVARDAYAELEQIAGDDPNAAPILAQARADIAAIERAQAEVLAQLDQERAYYEELMEKAGRNFPEYMNERTLGSSATRAVGRFDEGTAERARLFIRHVQLETRPETRGTYRWLSDFLPQG